ncbi:nitrous oxide-stimulated promoter family protein [Photobacterium jeanii]|uniref:nitrous oxide-stimulated promoter family protein n=1 Tax=Photobacterium jeanii TaxID=858640 RepID=UPI000A04D7E7|nr:nitrous oxide-stimulated promoter family protein [Photobacterium jeanii]PST88738.1 nitrous oxide-stimulated promoter family protein [Photobacterium jeanii]
MIVQNQHSVRSQRELDTVKAMIRLYCKTLHRGAIMCPECEGLIDYVEKRMSSCRLGAEKPTCQSCTASCYPPAKRLHLTHVLRWSLPRFFWRHPLKAMHFKMDGWRAHHHNNGHTTGNKVG